MLNSFLWEPDLRELTFSNVVLTNLSSDKQELTKQEPTVLSDLNDESQVNLWAGVIPENFTFRSAE